MGSSTRSTQPRPCAVTNMELPEVLRLERSQVSQFEPDLTDSESIVVYRSHTEQTNSVPAQSGSCAFGNNVRATSAAEDTRPAYAEEHLPGDGPGRRGPRRVLGYSTPVPGCVHMRYKIDNRHAGALSARGASADILASP
ncbi:hypothetical protein EVAR_92870_1 [Eumeta japonica]|uniref:Uncharacterized protein n=1 Tax=Eumeta variegata TaxID=151549 RepID=A0A4C1TA67_EUMVA|nr:hypothetical protein EVAR_92870_1 [Eumeta japonica]